MTDKTFNIPPVTEIPAWVWSRRYDPKPLKVKSSKLIETKIEEFFHPTREAALKAAKLAVRGFPGRHFGSMENGKGFLVYLNGKVIERHRVDPDKDSCSVVMPALL